MLHKLHSAQRARVRLATIEQPDGDVDIMLDSPL